MPSDICIIHNGSALVSNSFPFTKFFFLRSQDRGRPSLLIIEVTTAYTASSQTARVLLNGTQVGSISPHPWTNHGLILFDPVSIVIPGSSFSPSWFGSFNRLQIVPSGTIPTATDYLLVANVWLHFPQT